MEWPEEETNNARARRQRYRLVPFSGTIPAAGGSWASQPQGTLAMAKEKTLKDLFHDTLKDIYFAEKKILTALPKMAKAASSDALRAAFEKHAGETEKQVDRL